ncbi:MAG TPA: MFS transporter [Bryobacteraceae bacterium]
MNSSKPGWSRLRNLALFRALGSRNYRLFFSGQSVSLLGTWITRIATAWLVYQLSHSAFLLGLASFAGQIPLFFLAPIAGVWIDRWNRRNTLVATQTLSMLQSLALAFLTLSGRITVTDIILLSLFQGLVNAFDMPARQAFVVQMVDNRDDLPNAIALNSSIVNAARLVGPAIAGIVIAVAGEGVCFLIDGISYGGVIVSLVLMHIEAREMRAAPKRMWEELADGWTYVIHSVPIRSILLLLALISLFGMPYRMLMSIFATRVLHGGPGTLGNLMAATGMGALVGAVALANRRSVLGLGRVIPISAALLGAALVGFGCSGMLWLSMCLMVVTGFGMMRALAASNTILQTIVEEGKRGRVMSFYAVAFQGVAPFGSLIAGALAATIGAPETVLLGGACCLCGALLFARALPRLRTFIRPIYVERGIISEVATGIRDAEAS